MQPIPRTLLAVAIAACSVAYAGVVPRLVSNAAVDARVSVTGRGSSSCFGVSPDGASILLEVNVPDDSDRWSTGIVVRRLSDLHPTWTLVRTTGAAPGGDDSSFPQWALGGGSVVFESTAPNLVAGDTNGVSDIFVHDLAAGTTRLVSRSADGAPGSRRSSDPSVSPDGRFVGFQSQATNLVVGVMPTGRGEAYVADLQTGVLEALGIWGGDGISSYGTWNPHIALGGHKVVFEGTPIDVVGWDDPNELPLYVRNRDNGTTEQLAYGAASAGTPLAGSGLGPWEISPDGLHLAVVASPMALDASWIEPRVLWFDLTTLSNTSIGSPGELGEITGFVFSPDGKRIFVNTLMAIPGDASVPTVRVWEPGGSLRRLEDLQVTLPPFQASLTNATILAVSPDGARVVLRSTDAGVAPGAVGGLHGLYLRELASGAMTLLTRNASEAALEAGTGSEVAFSPDGSQVYFDTDAPLVAGDANEEDDVYSRAVAGGPLRLVTPDADGKPRLSGDSGSFFSTGAVSADGTVVAFRSGAADLVSGGAGASTGQHLYLRDLTSGAMEWITRPAEDGPDMPGIQGASVTPDGKHVLFTAARKHLVAGGTVGASNVFLYDRGTRSVSLVSAFTGADQLPTRIAWEGAMSDDARWVVFTSVPSAPGYSSAMRVYLTDTAGGEPTLISTNAPAYPGATLSVGYQPRISADGRFASYLTQQGDVVVRTNANGGMRVFPYSKPSGNRRTLSYAFSPAGDVVASYGFSPASGTNILILDVGTGRTNTTFPLPGRGILTLQFSPAGHHLVVSTTLPMVPQDTNRISDVYVADLDSKTVTLASVAPDGSAGNGRSDQGVIDATGTLVAFQSLATNLRATPDTNRHAQIYVRDLAKGETRLASGGTSGAPAFLPSSHPALSADGSRLVFQSLASELAEGDENGMSDVFQVTLTAVDVVDGDGDGLPDAWEQAHFKTLAFGASDDPDGDGASNLAEFLAGTDPSDAHSVLRISAAVSPTGARGLSWPTESGVHYRLESAADTVGPWGAVGVDTLGDGTKQGVEDGDGSVGSRFYRVRVVTP